MVESAVAPCVVGWSSRPGRASRSLVQTSMYGPAECRAPEVRLVVVVVHDRRAGVEAAERNLYDLVHRPGDVRVLLLGDHPVDGGLDDRGRGGSAHRTIVALRSGAVSTPIPRPAWLKVTALLAIAGAVAWPVLAMLGLLGVLPGQVVLNVGIVTAVLAYISIRKIKHDRAAFGGPPPDEAA
jgi:hypothetical protein